METHVKVLGVLHIVLGILGILGALTILLIFGGIAGLVGMSASHDPDARIAIPILGALGGGISVLILVLSLPGVIAGFGLLKFREWARVLTIILSALNLINVPIGTALGIYGLWVTLSQEGIRVFATHQQR